MEKIKLKKLKCMLLSFLPAYLKGMIIKLMILNKACPLDSTSQSKGPQYCPSKCYTTYEIYYIIHAFLNIFNDGKEGQKLKTVNSKELELKVSNGNVIISGAKIQGGIAKHPMVL